MVFLQEVRETDSWFAPRIQRDGAEYRRTSFGIIYLVKASIADHVRQSTLEVIERFLKSAQDSGYQDRIGTMWPAQIQEPQLPARLEDSIILFERAGLVLCGQMVEDKT